MILFRQVGFQNKGAELMLRSMHQKCLMMKKKSSIEATSIAGNYEQRSQLSLYSMPKFWRLGIQFAHILDFIPNKYLIRFGIVNTKSISCVWDAAGFAYTDSWGASLSGELLTTVRKFKRRGVPFIFLPQAFGPFENKKIAKNVRLSLELADLVFVRDEISLNFIKSLSLRDYSEKKYKLCPDFTLSLDVKKRELQPKMVGLVPNIRMIDKLGISKSQYVLSLQKICDFVKNEGYQVCLIMHEDFDRNLASEFNGLDCISGNAIELKEYISSCRYIISSRYHACVSALSQEIPVITIGWSHKYQELHKDWDVQDLLAKDLNEVPNKIKYLENHYKDIQSILKSSRTTNFDKVSEMWNRVFDLSK
jgi:polysaccharide pyruvyl transferase WcaK-like protein